MVYVEGQGWNKIIITTTLLESFWRSNGRVGLAQDFCINVNTFTCVRLYNRTANTHCIVPLKSCSSYRGRRFSSFFGIFYGEAERFDRPRRRTNFWHDGTGENVNCVQVRTENTVWFRYYDGFKQKYFYSRNTIKARKAAFLLHYLGQYIVFVFDLYRTEFRSDINILNTFETNGRHCSSQFIQLKYSVIRLCFVFSLAFEKQWDSTSLMHMWTQSRNSFCCVYDRTTSRAFKQA